MTDQLVNQIRGAYLEMPGLHVTRRQAQRLFGLDERTCVRLLDMLVDAGFLRRTRLDSYVRADEGSTRIGVLTILAGMDLPA